MTVQTRPATKLKQQISLLVDQLPPEQLPRLLHFLEQWLEQANRAETNGVTLNLPSAGKETAEEDQPWLKYTTKLKNSPNWDEFLEALAETRHTADEDDAGK